MKTVTLTDAKTHLSKLIREAANGESFVITKSGKPLVKVVAVDAPRRPRIQRLGFLAGQISVPDDFDRMGRKHLEEIFVGKDAVIDGAR